MTASDFDFVILTCFWPGSVGTSPAGASEWTIRIERRAVEEFKDRAKKVWPSVRIEVRKKEEEVDPLS